MDYRSAHIRRSRKSRRLAQRLAALALLGVAGCATLFALAMRGPVPAAPAVRAPDTAAMPAPVVSRAAAQAEGKKTRRVYPYSIVPGGVIDRRELARAVVADKVVAAHYAAFETARATVKTVGKPRAVYVSYRKGDQVYWTAKKLHLAEGETLLSDGRNDIRTRCGNRISDVPQLPVEADGPSEEELDASVEEVQADDGDSEGDVAQVGFAVDGNPAGQGYQLQTFASAGAQHGGTSPTRSAGLMGGRSYGPAVLWNGGGVPLVLASKMSSATTGTRTVDTDPAAGGPGTGGSPGADTSGTTPSGDTGLPTKLDDTALPPTDTGTPPPTTIPSTLLLPTTDLPGKMDDPGRAPARQGNVPEPGTPWLGGAGAAALLAARRARQRPRR